MKKVLAVLSIMIAMPALSPALAAAGHGTNGPAPPTESEQRAAARKAKEDEKAYKNALDRIPVSTKKQDPWDKMR